MSAEQAATGNLQGGEEKKMVSFNVEQVEGQNESDNESHKSVDLDNLDDEIDPLHLEVQNSILREK